MLIENYILYYPSPREDTPEDLVKIDFDSGQLAVDRSGAIDADEPRDKLYYTILASDRCSQPDNTTCGPDSTYFITEGKVIRIHCLLYIYECGYI